MLSFSQRLMRLMLLACLILGVAMFVGCGESDSGSSSNDGDNSSAENDDNDGDDGDNDDGDGGNGGNTPGGNNDGGSDGGNGGVHAGGIDHSSPEALFASMKDAAQREDLAAMCHAMTPDTQTQIAMGMIAMAATAGMNPAVDAAALAPVLEKHGIAQSDLPAMGPQMQEQAKTLAEGLDDPAAFSGEMMATLPPEMAADGMAAGAAAVTISDVQIDGDTATAQLTDANESGESQTISFVRIGGKWYVSPE